MIIQCRHTKNVYRVHKDDDWPLTHLENLVTGTHIWTRHLEDFDVIMERERCMLEDLCPLLTTEKPLTFLPNTVISLVGRYR
jgi:hypothetical protein